MIRSFIRPAARRHSDIARTAKMRLAFENLEAKLCLTAEPTIASMIITPSVIEGGTATLEVSFSDSRDLDHEAIVDWGDGSSDRLVFTSGERNFQLTHNYLDDNPTDTFAVNVTINAATIVVGDPVVFIVDISGSTSDQFGGSPVGDLNGDGDSNTILDAEIAGFIALNQSLIDAGEGDTSRVSVVGFDSSAFHIDVDPSTPGEQIVTTPLADKDNNGIRDVDQALKQLQYGGTTNYEAALQKAIETFTDVNAQVGHGTVVFLSDGYPNTGGPYADEVDTLRNDWDATLYAFGVGSGASLADLQIIDPNAVIFTDTDQLLDIFSGSGNGTGGGGTATGSLTIQVINAAPTVAIGNDQSIDLGQSASFAAVISDSGVLDTHTIVWSITDAGGTIVAQGNGVSFSFTPTSGGTYEVKAVVTDDDGGSATDIAQLIVAQELSGPTITAVERLGVHTQPTTLVLHFSDSMDPSSTGDASNYAIYAPGHDQRLGTADDRLMKIRNVRYNDADRTVRITPALSLRYCRPYRLIVNGSSEFGVSDTRGNLLDGDFDGTAGGDAVITLPRGRQNRPAFRITQARPALVKAPTIRSPRLTR